MIFWSLNFCEYVINKRLGLKIIVFKCADSVKRGGGGDSWGSF